MSNNPGGQKTPKKKINTPSQKNSRQLMIEGVTHSGAKFRPSDWAERMSGKLSTFRKHRLYYSPLLHPGFHKGNQCILLDRELKETNPELYQSILNFAKENHLRICGEEEEEDNT